MPITILDLARHRGAKFEEDGSIDGQALLDVGLDILGGCAGCQATLGAHNAFPSKSGYWACRDCVDDNGFESGDEFDQWAAEGGWDHE